MSDRLVHIEGAPRPRIDPREIARVAANLSIVCAIGAVVLGAVFVATDRYQTAAHLASERAAVAGMLALGPDASVIEVRQFLAPASREVVYRARRYGDASAPERVLVFGLDGAPHAALAAGASKLAPLGRLFVARSGGAPAGFVIEGEARGYKNVIRYFVALDTAFCVRGVRVLEHQEDPGLGAEVATTVFQGQFVGRSSERMSALTVTRDPMPEDWRAALGELATRPVDAWKAAHAPLLAREAARPIYAVTGATISSRALTNGVRATVDHFRRRWALLAPRLGDLS